MNKQKLIIWIILPAKLMFRINLDLRKFRRRHAFYDSLYFEKPETIFQPACSLKIGLLDIITHTRRNIYASLK